ncbi:DUF922 domain-containing protein [Vulcaniibacterium gelatinicum]|uniref:DUF922 domain-containing protein n=1 Tax=Vulcaniibacterium gelatinicum TaxID=2598725 RepID=UPI0015F2EA45|nr:DUF922 domain-containing protein [Vulcaniibacterium gelatinicum]
MLALLLGGAAGVHAAERVVPTLTFIERHTTYPVEATSLRELRRTLEQGMGSENRGSSNGLTRSRIEVAHTADAVEGRCRVHEIEIRVQVEITLPRWAGPGQPPAQWREAWEKSLAALRMHEQGHRDNAMAAAVALQERLAALPPADECKALGRTVMREFDRAMLRLALRDEAYDRLTQHGLKQGTVLRAPEPP